MLTIHKYKPSMSEHQSEFQSEKMTQPIIAVEHVFKSVTDSTGTLDILRDIDFQ